MVQALIGALVTLRSYTLGELGLHDLAQSALEEGSQGIAGITEQIGVVDFVGPRYDRIGIECSKLD